MHSTKLKYCPVISYYNLHNSISIEENGYKPQGFDLLGVADTVPFLAVGLMDGFICKAFSGGAWKKYTWK